MAGYHGDLMYKLGSVYTRQDNRNYPIALILLFFLGFTGLHRFYLNDVAIGSAYMFPMAITLMIGIISLNFTLFGVYLGIASLALLAEFFYFIYCWLKK
ncbi:MAG: NINE protein [Erythrobacter sp.]